ncbi:MAG: hypothetical protein KAU20_03280 [Nanoarchaeota archaeon]|nr:hypothetical protein [Nanoarchaeota archaeon]
MTKIQLANDMNELEEFDLCRDTLWEIETEADYADQPRIDFLKRASLILRMALGIPFDEIILSV